MQDREELTVDMITPEKMKEVDERLEKAAIENEQFNGKNLVNVYTCQNPACEHQMVTVDTHVGVTPFSMACDTCNAGSAYSQGYRPIKHRRTVDDENIHYEWYRPITEEECAELRERYSILARARAAQSDDRTWTRAEIEEIVANDLAGHVLNGGLERRYVGPEDPPEKIEKEAEKSVQPRYPQRFA